MVLSGTMGHANPSFILEHLLHRTNSVATFGEIRHLLTGRFLNRYRFSSMCHIMFRRWRATGMLENTWFEEQLVKTTQKVVCSDLYSQLVSSIDSAKRGIRASNSSCSACNKPLVNSSVFIFFCGHSQHEDCMTDYQCPICSTLALDKASEK